MSVQSTICPAPSQGSSGAASRVESGLGAVQLEIMGLVGVVAAVDLVAGLLAPLPSTCACTIHSTGRGVFIGRPEIPAFGITGALFVQASAPAQIAGKRLQHMLPGTDGVGIADADQSPLRGGHGCMSGISRSPAQSPPPMTLPARAVARPHRARAMRSAD